MKNSCTAATKSDHVDVQVDLMNNEPKPSESGALSMSIAKRASLISSSSTVVVSAAQSFTEIIGPDVRMSKSIRCLSPL